MALISSSLVVEDTPLSSSLEFGEDILPSPVTVSGCVELTGETCGPSFFILLPLLLVESNCCSVFGLDVVLLASPFSTVVCCALLLPGVVQVATVLVAVVVLRLAPLRIPVD